MRRTSKTCRFGERGTFYATLPLDWVRQVGLEWHDLLDVEYDDERVTFRPAKKTTKATRASVSGRRIPETTARAPFALVNGSDGEVPADAGP